MILFFVLLDISYHTSDLLQNMIFLFVEILGSIKIFHPELNSLKKKKHLNVKTPKTFAHELF